MQSWRTASVMVVLASVRVISFPSSRNKRVPCTSCRTLQLGKELSVQWEEHDLMTPILGQVERCVCWHLDGALRSQLGDLLCAEPKFLQNCVGVLPQFGNWPKDGLDTLKCGRRQQCPEWPDRR